MKFPEQEEFEDPEKLVSDIWTELDRRRVLASNYPFSVIRERVERTNRWTNVVPYSFQLLLALQSEYRTMRMTGAKWNKTAKLFERLATAALEKYVTGKALNIGAPRDGKIPKGFNACLDFVCENTKETRGSEKAFNSFGKDESVDVLVWVPFGDRRPGQVVILAQCAAGSDWRRKANELSLNLWKRLVTWAVDPVMSFAIPFVFDEDKWIYYSSRGGLLLDRLRISSVSGRGSFPPNLIQDLRAWCRDQIPHLPVASS